VNQRRRFLFWIATLLAWLTVFVAHGYLQVRALTGQCCGYEGDPGILLLFFLFWPGLLYLLALVLILIAGLFMFLWPLPKE
jgi:hypothetical protein